MIEDNRRLFGRPLESQIAVTSAAHLKEWLQKSGREFIIFPSGDLVDALPWPAGVEAFQHFVIGYRQHRRTIESGRTREWDPKLNREVEFVVYKDETLTPAEMDRAICCLVRDLTKIRPDWRM